MIEAKMESPLILKKLLDAIKELVTDANFDCNEEGLKLQAMDNSHVALVAVDLKEEAFLQYRCDRPMPLGVNLASLTKVIKCAKDDDTMTLRASDDQDVLHLTYESKHTDRIAEYDMKLMDIDADQLGIPETDYDATVRMSSSEFQRIMRDLSNLGESVKIEVNKEGVKFVSEGESANGTVLLKQSGGGRIDRVPANNGESAKVKKEDGDDDDDDVVEEPKKKEKKKVKKEKKDERMDEDDEELDDGGPPGSASEGEAEKDKSGSEASGSEGEDEDGDNKKRKRSSKSNGSPKKKKVKADSSKKKKKEVEDEEEGATIHMNQHVTLTFSLKYLVNFSKSASLCKNVMLMMSNAVPLLVKYDFGSGSIAYYLAPKIGDD